MSARMSTTGPSPLFNIATTPVVPDFVLDLVPGLAQRMGGNRRCLHLLITELEC